MPGGHYDPNSTPRSPNMARASAKPRRSASPYGHDAMSGSCISRLDTNATMRERAASLWLEQLRSKHEKRADTLKRKQELERMQRDNTLSKIEQQEAMVQHNRRKQNEMLDSRSEAFRDRQEYLHKAKDHAELLVRLRSQHVDQETQMKMKNAEVNHQRHVETRVIGTAERNRAKEEVVSRSQQMMERKKMSKAQQLAMAEQQKEMHVMSTKQREEYERAQQAQERDALRQETLKRADMIASAKRQNTEAKLRHDSERSQTVLKRREEWLRQRHEMNREKEAVASQQVKHAEMVRKMKAKQYENHFEESLAIGRQTAEHNKMFKLNNKIMHELMKDMIGDAKRSTGALTPRRM
eukprot:TRINITY_DN1768_c1_g2_i2.p1 TRINITY_DN1768_c1_g2~~TRINITY_DN1768_c1_g2_i2.p1  ORF type:complete len:353 (+),score=179.49 TRINITY_DN1768_c1_g2_i2:65-1123(+)